MKILTRGIITAIIGLIACQVQAQGLNYRYIELQFLEIEADGSGNNNDGDGINLSLSIDLSNSFFVNGNVQRLNYDAGVEADEFLVGIGAHTALSGQTDMFGTVSYLDTELANAIDDTGYELKGGIRHLLSENLELAGNANYRDILNGYSTGLEVVGRYNFSNSFSFGLSYYTDDNFDGYSIGCRVNF